MGTLDLLLEYDDEISRKIVFSDEILISWKKSFQESEQAQISLQELTNIPAELATIILSYDGSRLSREEMKFFRREDEDLNILYLGGSTSILFKCFNHEEIEGVKFPFFVHHDPNGHWLENNFTQYYLLTDLLNFDWDQLAFRSHWSIATFIFSYLKTAKNLLAQGRVAKNDPNNIRLWFNVD